MNSGCLRFICATPFAAPYRRRRDMRLEFRERQFSLVRNNSRSRMGQLDDPLARYQVGVAVPEV
jgi:hypothetical protein